MLSPSQEYCYWHRITGGMLPWSQRARQPTQPSVFPIYLGSMLPQSGTLSSFSALTLFLGRHEGHPARKVPSQKISNSLLLGIGLTRSNLTWNNSRKISRSNKNQVHVWWTAKICKSLTTRQVQQYSTAKQWTHLMLLDEFQHSTTQFMQLQ